MVSFTLEWDLHVVKQRVDALGFESRPEDGGQTSQILHDGLLGASAIGMGAKLFVNLISEDFKLGLNFLEHPGPLPRYIAIGCPTPFRFQCSG